MKIRFLADIDLNQIIVQAVLRREPVIDFHIAQKANLDGLSDLAVLDFAAKTGRVIVSHDRKTMPKYFAEFITNQESQGLIIIPQKLPIRIVVDDLILIWSVSEPEEWINRILLLPL